MKDHLIIGTAAGGTVRVYTCLSSKIVEEARLIHDTWPTATAALGRVLTGTLMMGVMSDSLFRLTVEFKGNGPGGKVLAVSNKRGTVKGYIDDPHVDPPLNNQGKLDVRGVIGEGNLTVIKDLGLKEPYLGIVPLQSGEVGEDFAYYFTKSEQTPSAVALGVLVNPDGSVKVAGGMIIQLMPGVSNETVNGVEAKLNEFASITKALDTGATPSELFHKITADLGESKVLEEVDILYQCDCSFERFRRPLLSLDPKDINDLMEEQGQIEVRCQFCNKLYHYHRDELTC